MDVAHAILLYGKIDFSRLTADYLSAKFELGYPFTLFIVKRVSLQRFSCADYLIQITPHQIILYHAPQFPHDKMRSYHRAPPYVRAASPSLPQD